LADREFIGEDWQNFLNTNGIHYHIRIRDNFKIFNPRKQKEMYGEYAQTDPLIPR